MKLTLAHTTVALICIISLFSETMSQHFLKFVGPGKNPYAGKPQISSTSPPGQLQSINLLTRNAESLCAYGIWALYSRPNFGEGSETSTTVLPILSSDLTNCTKTPGLGIYQSARFLGNPTPIESGVSFFSLPNFLGNSSTSNTPSLSLVDPDKNITGFKTGSIGLTGKDSWLICGEDTCKNATTTVCVNMAAQTGGTLFTATNIPADKTTKWPAIVVLVKTTADPLECAKFPNPPPPPPSALELYNRKK